MANEQNNQTQNTEFQGTENQSSFDSIGSTQDSGSTSATTGATSGSTGLSTESAKEAARGLYDQAKSTAGQAYGVATKKATEVLEEKKGGLAEGLSGVADSLRQVGDTLRENEAQAPLTGKAAEYGETLAEQIEKISRYFDNNDVRTMVRDVENFARRNPAIFIGGAFALGVLAARFLKASPRNIPSDNRNYYASDESYDNRLTGVNDSTTSETNFNQSADSITSNPS